MRYVLLLSFNLALMAAPFKLQTISPPTDSCNLCELSVSTSGTVATSGKLTVEQILLNRHNWRLKVFEKSGDSLQEIPFGFISIRMGQSSVAGETWVYFRFSRTQLKGKDLSTLKWSLLFTGPGDFQTIQSPDAPGGGTAPGTTTSLKDIFSPAKARDDADLYISGSILMGQGTKPIYMLDAKLNFAPPVSRNDIRVGVKGEIQSNTSATPPNDRSTIDPDSITASATINQLHNSFYWELKPAGGEFSRKYPESNFVSSGTVAWWPIAKPVPGGWRTFYPSIGIEAGTNLNKPTVLFKQPADLSHYNTIARIVATVPITYYVWGQKDDPKVTINGSYQVRLLLADEPFTTYDYYTKSDGTRDRAQFVHMRDNARHWVTAGVTWNFSDYVGITAQYKFGSLPPLFELVSHQVTLGVVFKSKLWAKQ